MRKIKLNVDDMVAVFDKEAGIYEIFIDSECDVYLGCADTIEQAKEALIDVKLTLSLRIAVFALEDAQRGRAPDSSGRFAAGCTRCCCGR